MTEEQKREDVEETIRKIKRLVGRDTAPEPPAIDVDPTMDLFSVPRGTDDRFCLAEQTMPRW